MIRVALISSSSDSSEIQLLSKQADLNSIAIVPTNIQSLVDQLKLFMPNILVIEDSVENVSIDGLCHYLSKYFPNARSLILTSDKPTFERLQNSGFKARGYIMPEQRTQLDKAVRVVSDGEAWLPRKLVTDMLNRFTSTFIMHGEPEIAVDK